MEDWSTFEDKNPFCPSCTCQASAQRITSSGPFLPSIFTVSAINSLYINIPMSCEQAGLCSITAQSSHYCAVKPFLPVWYRAGTFCEWRWTPNACWYKADVLISSQCMLNTENAGGDNMWACYFHFRSRFNFTFQLYFWETGWLFLAGELWPTYLDVKMSFTKNGELGSSCT